MVSEEIKELKKQQKKTFSKNMDQRKLLRESIEVI